MSLFSWIFPTKKNADKPTADSSGLSRMDATRPVRRGSRDMPVESNAQPANRKHERMARRELLYSVVRQAMMRAGVLSSGYKFKVLSLDARGRQFLVMIDLSRERGVEVTQLAEIEAMIAQSAKTRHDILVSAVYWRMSEHVALGHPKVVDAAQRAPAAAVAAPVAAFTESQPALLDSSPAPLDSSPAPLEGKAGTRYEPIGDDEVAAFKRAFAVGATSELPPTPQGTGAGVQAAHGASALAFDGRGLHGPQSYTLLTGFEDTEVADDARAPILSGTQYGELN